jgi:sulfatase modifying factor 1
MLKRKFRSTLLTSIVLLLAACTNPVPNDVGGSLRQFPAIENFQDLEQEYTFKTKELTQSYLERKFDRWLDTENNRANINGPRLVKELYYAMFKHPQIFTAIIRKNPLMLTTINNVSDVSARKSLDTAFKDFLDNLAPPPVKMIFVQGGTFQMGNSSQAPPAHTVSLSNFYIGKYEVTQKEYFSVLGINPSSFAGENRPVENVDWYATFKYCNARSRSDGLPVAYNEITGQLLDESGNVTTNTKEVKGYRLPTEAEWEFAARGGNNSLGFTYSGSNNPDEVAWYNSNAGGMTHDVGLKLPNELGLYDMTGNVWEWSTDYLADYIPDEVPGIPNNPGAVNPYITTVNPIENRGGSWVEPALQVYRRSSGYNITLNYLGFRIALSAQ